MLSVPVDLFCYFWRTWHNQWSCQREQNQREQNVHRVTRPPLKPTESLNGPPSSGRTARKTQVSKARPGPPACAAPSADRLPAL
jgi:hypothetical protein